MVTKLKTTPRPFHKLSSYQIYNLLINTDSQVFTCHLLNDLGCKICIELYRIGMNYFITDHFVSGGGDTVEGV